MKLYEEIIFLQHYFEGKYCIENVIPYYKPLILAQKRDRHLYWTNFNLPNKLSDRGRGKNLSDMLIKDLSTYHDFDFNKYNGKQSRLKMGRNLVDYEAGKTILETALGVIRKQNENQLEMF
jgi:DNA (cytosine-5)-methyltransferase 1